MAIGTGDPRAAANASPAPPGARVVLAGAALFAMGIVLFSGSLYALVLGDATGFGAVTPFGGVAFTAGWLARAWALWRR
ncbi:MAG: DUF423 domain-containing protein [Burkholderiales bacterium]|nr:DUF423 domain-containing protein [Burkholderiales bacterium]